MRNALAQSWRAVAPYLAELGEAAAAAMLAYVVFAFAVELALPNSVASVVSPQGLALALLGASLLALLGPERRRSWRSCVVTAAAAAALAFGAWWAAWYYFGPVPDSRHWLAAAAAVAAALLVTASRIRAE